MHGTAGKKHQHGMAMFTLFSPCRRCLSTPKDLVDGWTTPQVCPERLEHWKNLASVEKELHLEAPSD